MRVIATACQRREARRKKCDRTTDLLLVEPSGSGGSSVTNTETGVCLAIRAQDHVEATRDQFVVQGPLDQHLRITDRRRAGSFARSGDAYHM